MNSKEENVTVNSIAINAHSSAIFTIPNIISFTRILLIVPFIIFFLMGEYIVAFSFIVLSGISDCLDGFLARKLNQISDLGKLLDPVADKLTLVAVVICLGILIPKMMPIVVLLVFKDVLMLIGGFYLLKKDIIPPPAKWYGKVATTVFYVSVVTIVFFRGFLEYEIYLLTIILLSLTFAVMMFALIKYAIVFKNLLKEKNKENK